MFKRKIICKDYTYFKHMSKAMSNKNITRCNLNIFNRNSKHVISCLKTDILGMEVMINDHNFSNNEVYFLIVDYKKKFNVAHIYESQHHVD